MRVLVRGEVEFRAVADLLVDLTTEMEDVQRACSAASDAVAHRYFPRSLTTTWVEEGVS